MRTVFTTGQVAKICGVSTRTVMVWFDKGLIRGYHVPGSKDRRIPRAELLRVLKENGIPRGDLEAEGWHKVLFVGADKLLIERVKAMLPDDQDYRCRVADSTFEAGLLVRDFRPDTVVIDLSMGRTEGAGIAQSLRRDTGCEHALVIALAGEDESAPEKLAEYGFDEVFKRPFDAALLGDRIRALVWERAAEEARYRRD